MHRSMVSDAARSGETVTSMVPSTLSCARASATENAYGPGTVMETVFESALPSSVQSTAGWSAPQVPPPASLTVTSPLPEGSTLSSRRSLLPSTRFALVT